MKTCAFILLALFFAPDARTQGPSGSKPRPKPADYEVQAHLPDADLGVDYLVQSVPNGEDSLVVDDYLVVEIAVYPKSHEGATVNVARLGLRLNGKKDVVLAQAPAAVISSIKYEGSALRPRAMATAGVGDTGIILGRPTPVERFPGDPRVASGRLPPRPEAPANPAGVKRVGISPAETIQTLSLPEGQTKHPVSGYVYFPYTGKLKSLKSVELLIQSDSDPIVVRLR